MAKKKRHHYIPRFYLKRFSINNEGKFLGLYNHNSDIFVQQASLRHQAYENFLYGEDDEIENALADMEGNVARMFYYWTEEKLLYPPPLETEGYKLLKRFILYQIFRTPKSGNDMIQALNQGFKTLVKECESEFWGNIKDCTIVHESPVLFGLLNSIGHEHLLDYLDCKFLVNLSQLSFITSDAPVILYNQLLEKSENYMGATSLTAKGLQIFYPIHPRLMICLYDSKVYDFGNGCINCCSTESIEEIHQLNGLQLINSKSQIFFDEFISEEYIKELCDHYEEYRGTAKNINKIINKGSRKFFLTSSEKTHIDLSLSFFKLKVNPNDFTKELCPIRHPSLERPSNKGISFEDQLN
ncbi:DUF4238 domain-containing protein [Arcicella lustrica]|uniref:DUF4238 domain-containing protein n=1 Tax=Arcicella lustrica TaxID=2984196 RepID=A0ABU5SDN5_9BACT|nr:DUF4238 domain-containing protein [Arcicella sp. DC25W]MEA5425404.1 DUF4238 domain-containing protein [Arcicella sp. DC25W]